jgi:hypothetical protein
MAMINCPECGNLVSDKAKACIHCGCTLEKEKNILRIKTPNEPQVQVRLTYQFIDRQTGTVLGTINQNQILTLELDKPTTIICHLGKGWKDCELVYVPSGIQKYTINKVNGCMYSAMSFAKVDVIDSD